MKVPKFLQKATGLDPAFWALTDLLDDCSGPEGDRILRNAREYVLNRESYKANYASARRAREAKLAELAERRL